MIFMRNILSKKFPTNTSNLFTGTWADGSVSIIIDATTWTAKYGSSIYNSGAYTCSGSSAQLKVTGKGSGSTAVGATGTATVAGSKYIVKTGNYTGKFVKE